MASMKGSLPLTYKLLGFIQLILFIVASMSPIDLAIHSHQLAVGVYSSWCHVTHWQHHASLEVPIEATKVASITTSANVPIDVGLEDELEGS